MNKDISKFEKWDQDSIEQRANMLIEKFLEIWPYFGKPENEMKKITGSSPRLLIINQQSYSVKTWREVMEKTVLFIFEEDIDGYKKVMDKNPGFLSVEGKDMRKAKKLTNEHYIEVNLGAQAIYNFCVKAFEDAGYSKANWDVETEFK